MSAQGVVVHLAAYGFFLIALSSPAIAQSPTDFPCTQQESDSGLPVDNGVDQETGCNQIRFRRFSSYDAGLNQYYCYWSAWETTTCPNTNPITTPSPSPSSTSSATPAALPASGLSFQEEGQLNLAVRRLTPSGFSLPTSGCQLPMLNAYIGAAESVECPGGNAMQNAMSNASLKLARAVLPPDQFLLSKPPENQNLLERFRHWLFSTLVTKAFGISG